MECGFDCSDCYTGRFPYVYLITKNKTHVLVEETELIPKQLILMVIIYTCLQIGSLVIIRVKTEKNKHTYTQETNLHTNGKCRAALFYTTIPGFSIYT